MSSSADPSTNNPVTVLSAAATACGARPFKDAKGNWSGSVELALLDTILSINAHVDGVFGAGVLPRLRAFKAFRGPANMMRVAATLGPIGLADFIARKDHLDMFLKAAGALLDAGVNTADDVEPASTQQRTALTGVIGVPEIAWDYFLLTLEHSTEQTQQLREMALESFTTRALGAPTPAQELASLLDAAAAALNEQHQSKSFGRLPEFTTAQLIQAITRAEYARRTAF